MCEDNQAKRELTREDNQAQRDAAILRRTARLIEDYSEIIPSEISQYQQRERRYELRVMIKQSMEALLNNLPV